MSSYSTTHDGLERVLEGTRVLTHAVGPTRSLRTVPLIVLTGIVTAVVAVASRQFADAMAGRLPGEWLATRALSALPRWVRVTFLARSPTRWCMRPGRFSGRLASPACREGVSGGRAPRPAHDCRHPGRPKPGRSGVKQRRGR
ncbi:MAG: hypothetical protein IPM01_31315 [Burkholderiaceae bacterium]|nr:hypothetical protein [Burkholderiaceae bacterium]